MKTNFLKALLVLLLIGDRASATQITNAGPSLSVIQGDKATFSAQFFDADGNSGVTLRALHVASGQAIGQFARDDSSGDLQWSCDTSPLPAGSNAVQLIATDGAGASTVVSFSLNVTAASPVQQWRQTYFGSSQDGGNAVNTADPDGDGLSNYAEFAFGTNPVKGGGDIGSKVQLDGPSGKMRAIFRRRSDYLSTGVAYVYEFSSDLQEWEAVAIPPQVISDDGVMQNLSVEFPVLSNGQSSRFFRTRLP